MDMKNMAELNEFWKEQRKLQARTTVEIQAPVIAEYFEELQKVNNDDKYKKIILDLIEQLNNSKDELEVKKVLDGYQRIIKSYKEKIKRAEKGDKRIIVREDADIQKTKDIIAPVEVICSFVDNLLYGGFTKRKIQRYLDIWKEKSTYNILKPADGITTSENGRHGKNPYHEIEEQR